LFYVSIVFYIGSLKNSHFTKVTNWRVQNIQKSQQWNHE